jgi:hypothetical protein
VSEVGAEIVNVIYFCFMLCLVISVMYTRCKFSVVLRTGRYMTVTSHLRHGATNSKQQKTKQVGRK